jgi:hypothetical protein
MKPLPLWLFALAALAQEGAKEVASPVSEKTVDASGSMEIGYRWRSDVGGNFNAYRSVVDLGSGPKLFNFDFTAADKSRKWFDRLAARASGLGGDPYATARIDVFRERTYRLTWDFRNLVYFNNLASFANPQLERGVQLSQRSFDTRRRINNLQLDLLPGRRIIPYVAFSRDSGSGSGVTTFVAPGNEYPVATALRDQTNHYRGGVRLEAGRTHATIELGGTDFKDDQQVYTSDRNLGNRTAPVLGQQLNLSSLEQAYGVRGDSTYSKALMTLSPWNWLNVTGQFLYSRPSTTVNYFQRSGGLFVDIASLTFFTTQQERLLTGASQPHTSGDIGVELLPFSRLRILESWMTDRLHQSASTGAVLTGLPDVEYSRQQIEVLYDITRRLTVRGGHRYVWGTASVLAPLVFTARGIETGELRRHAGLAGLTYRAAQKLSFSVDAEAGSGDRTYFRASLNDYQRIRARARYQLAASLTLSGSFAFLNNENPARTIQHEFRSQDLGASLNWTPSGGKVATVLAEYTRSTLRSDLSYFVPQTLQREQSLYRDNAHTGSVVSDWKLRGAKLGVGGAFFVSTGSRPTSYFQPLMRFAIPLYAHMQWTSEWRWYGFTERFYVYEGFRAHLFAAGLRYSR